MATVSDDLKLALLRLLVEGHEDKVISKRLGISLRTYQRHLAEIMKRIGARNRSHGGYLVHKMRLLYRDS
ncbi:LuxR C-terminal-related transcriptional regulator [Streptomyces sp. V3I7]|uniref:LuxR C-terminal-related transcriptional regulator n=1 Tax=Streptomyces sp. V3I7 TaxID=3042278 RepID=UPI0027D7A922|nr:LuxR C-terminal-related transcriptional regulator [Streptomyces sp. V3I7]